jgi:MerR family mercuric resistance operon transcriptional regulator
MSLSIGKVARLSGVSIDTIRFYERNGLIPDPPRRDSGYRDYPEETVFRLQFIKNAKDLGFSLAEIRELLGLRTAEETHCESVQKMAEVKIQVVKGKIQSLVRIQLALERLLDLCRESDNIASVCPLLDVLEKRDG